MKTILLAVVIALFVVCALGEGETNDAKECYPSACYEIKSKVEALGVSYVHAVHASADMLYTILNIRPDTMAESVYRDVYSKGVVAAFLDFVSGCVGFVGNACSFMESVASCEAEKWKPIPK
jgi:hypothetical protein